MTRHEVEIVTVNPTKNMGPTRIQRGMPAVYLRQGGTYLVDEEFFDPSIMEKVEKEPEDTSKGPAETEGEEEPEPDDAPEEPATSEPEPAEDEEDPYYPQDEELSLSWLKDELQAYAEDRDLSTSGTKAEILERIKNRSDEEQ